MRRSGWRVACQIRDEGCYCGCGRVGIDRVTNVSIITSQRRKTRNQALEFFLCVLQGGCGLHMQGSFGACASTCREVAWRRQEPSWRRPQDHHQSRTQSQHLRLSSLHGNNPSAFAFALSLRSKRFLFRVYIFFHAASHCLRACIRSASSVMPAWAKNGSGMLAASA